MGYVYCVTQFIDALFQFCLPVRAPSCVLYLGIIVINIHVGSRVEYMEGKGGGFGCGRHFNLKSNSQQLSA